MQLLSEHNRILRIGEGGGGIEYSAGPNIDITNHVISGRDWSDDIDDAVMSGISSTSGDIVNEAYNQSTAWVDEQGYLTAHQDVSNLPYVQNSALEYNGVLISGISGSGLFAESANNSYHSDDSYHADYADSANSAGYAESAGYTELADSAHVADYAVIAESAYGLVNGYSGILPIVVDNEHMLISAQSAKLGVQDPLYFVEDTSASTVIGIYDSAFPTFEGTEDGKISAINGSALNADPIIDYSAGNNIDITDHVISVTGSVPSADRADYAVSATSSHYSHSAIEAASADSATYDNLGREITATYLTAVTGDNTPYSAGANIDITDHVVSGKDWTSEIQEASANAVNEAVNTITAVEFANSASALTTSAGWDVTEYTAGANIDITDHVISGKDWTDDITAASSYAYEQATAQIPTELTGAYVPLSATECIIGSANTATNESLAQGISNSAWGKAFSQGSANSAWGESLAQGLGNSANGDALAQGVENTARYGIAQGYRNSATDRSIAQGIENSANTDAFAQGNENSAYNKAIAQGSNNTAYNYAIAQGYKNTAHHDSIAQGSENSAYDHSIAQGFKNSAISDGFAQGSDNLAIDNSMAQGFGNSAYVGSQALGYANIMSGHGMAIGQYNKTSADAYFVVGDGTAENARSDAFIIFKDGSVSAKGDISANGVKLGAGGGIEYEGIAPIVVNNLEHKISAQSAKLGVQSPLYFVEDSVSATIIGISGLPEGQDIMYESALGLSAGTITSYNNSAFGGGVQSDWTETATTNLAYIKHKPSEYNLVAGQNITFTLAGNDLTIDAIGGGSTIPYTTGSI